MVDFATVETLKTVVAVLCVSVWISIRLIHVLAIVYGKWRLHKKSDPSQITENELPGVSILKPLVNSSDPSLFQNLETFFTLDYPKYEILFCIQDGDDQKIPIYVNSLRKKYPSVETKTFIGGENVNVNPKINNMQPGYKAAKYELLLISDSGIRMRCDTLLDMVSHMTENVGLVHQLPFSFDRTNRTLTSILEKVYFGTSHARMYLTANLLGMNCTTGMSSLVRRECIETDGGLAPFGKYLAEDFFIAQAIQKKGLHTVISSQPALQNAGDSSISFFQSRIIRWTKLRTAMVPLAAAMEPLTECILLGILTAWAVCYLFRWNPMTFFLVHLLTWSLMDCVLLHVVQNGELPFNKAEFLVMWIYREVSAPYLFISAQMNPVINWRSNLFRLRWGGLVERLNEKVHV